MRYIVTLKTKHLHAIDHQQLVRDLIDTSYNVAIKTISKLGRRLYERHTNIPDATIIINHRSCQIEFHGEVAQTLYDLEDLAILSYRNLLADTVKLI